MPLDWKIDECAEYYGGLILRGWGHHAPEPIVAVSAVFPGDEPVVVPLSSFGQPSPDVAGTHGASAARCRFDEWVPVPAGAIGRDFYLRFFLRDHSSVRSSSALANARAGDAFHSSWPEFLEKIAPLESGAILELGSRARSAVVRREQVPPQLRYVGLDILPGPNVDIVGDAHEMAGLLGRGRFDAAFSFSVFEHLAMPWKVALELNQVLVPGGLVYVSTHQTWPLHDEPWDFWRFSEHSWQALFNAATGFEIVQTFRGDPARIHACVATPVTRTLHLCPAYLGSAVIARKTGETELTWPVPRQVAAASMYPQGELAVSPLG